MNFFRKPVMGGTPAAIYPVNFPQVLPQVARPTQTAHLYYHGAMLPVKSISGVEMTIPGTREQVLALLVETSPNLCPEYYRQIDESNYIILIDKP